VTAGLGQVDLETGALPVESAEEEGWGTGYWQQEEEVLGPGKGKSTENELGSPASMESEYQKLPPWKELEAGGVRSTGSSKPAWEDSLK
jgi:hypothetical protein